VSGLRRDILFPPAGVTTGWCVQPAAVAPGRTFRSTARMVHGDFAPIVDASAIHRCHSGAIDPGFTRDRHPKCPSRL